GADRAFTTTNPASAPLNVTGISLGGADPGDFALIAGSNPVTLAPNGSQTVSLTFTPTALGSRNAIVSIADDAAGSPHTVTLTGTGTLPLSPAVSISPGSLDFGNQRAGTTAAAQAFRLTNAGNAPLHIAGITLQGANAGDFAFSAGSGITTLAAGASQDISLTFTPSARGSRTAAVVIADDAADSPQSVSLAG